MKKIFNTLFIMVAIFCSCFSASYASGCSQVEKGGKVIGAACSIEELNNINDGRALNNLINFQPKVERNLRPLRFDLERIQVNGTCIFNKCLFRGVIEGESRNK